jgi:hypothetical protein
MRWGKKIWIWIGARIDIWRRFRKDARMDGRVWLKIFRRRHTDLRKKTWRYRHLVEQKQKHKVNIFLKTSEDIMLKYDILPTSIRNVDEPVRRRRNAEGVRYEWKSKLFPYQVPKWCSMLQLCVVWALVGVTFLQLLQTWAAAWNTNRNSGLAHASGWMTEEIFLTISSMLILEMTTKLCL